MVDMPLYTQSIESLRNHNVHCPSSKYALNANEYNLMDPAIVHSCQCKEESVHNNFIDVKFPNRKTRWIRGMPTCIEWNPNDISISHVSIELCQIGSTATTLIVSSTPNTGFFVYKKVPWGMITGDSYFLKFSPVEENNSHRPSISSPRVFYTETFRIDTDPTPTQFGYPEVSSDSWCSKF